MSNVLSIDLAARSYRDFGFAFLEAGSSRPAFPRPEDLGLQGRPDPAACAAALTAFAEGHDVTVLLLDGPQAWRWPKSPIEPMRLAEAVLNTPAKTGVPGEVRPKTYLPFVRFSIALFAHLHRDHGWALPDRRWARRGRRTRFAVETFPSVAWDLLGLPRLPSKRKTTPQTLRRWARDLARMTGLDLPSGLSHDELQTAVVLPAGRAIAERRPQEVLLVGFDPFPGPDGNLYEGWIACPRAVG